MKNSSEDISTSSDDSIWTTEVKKQQLWRRKSCEFQHGKKERKKIALFCNSNNKKLVHSSSVSESLAKGWSDARSDIFYIYDEQWTSGSLTNQETAKDIMKESTLMHHSNLEVSQLTARQQTRLACIYYCNWRFIIRGLVLMAALAWFIFNVYKVFADFISSDTVVYLEYQKPDLTLPPAVSVCVACQSCL